MIRVGGAIDEIDVDREVCAGCDPEVAAVYADVLIERGDPRGELVAIDVALATNVDDPQLHRRRAELLDTVFGPERPRGQVRYGFIDVDATGADPLEQLDLGLRDSLSPYVRSVAVAGDVTIVRRAFDRIARQLRPSLYRCVFSTWWSGNTALWRPGQAAENLPGADEGGMPWPTSQTAPPRPQATVDLRVAQRFCEATPRLAEMSLSGRRVVEALSHPTIETIQMSGYDVVKLEHLPRLRCLDFALHSPVSSRESVPPPFLLQGLFDPVRLPRLTVLDLSRNRPGDTEPFNLGGAVNFHKLLLGIPIIAQIEQLRLPPFRREQDAATLQLALGRMPCLVSLEILRVPEGHRPWYAGLHHPRARISVETWPMTNDVAGQSSPSEPVPRT